MLHILCCSPSSELQRPTTDCSRLQRCSAASITSVVCDYHVHWPTSVPHSMVVSFCVCMLLRKLTALA